MGLGKRTTIKKLHTLKDQALGKFPLLSQPSFNPNLN